MQFEFPNNQNSIIKVIGVGGGGGNAVNNMFEKGIDGVDFVVCNTDMQALKISPVPTKIRLGASQTEGLGAGANPEVGKQSAQESLEDVSSVLQANTKMVFITAGMGGGTGTGAAPVIAKMCKELGILTVGIVTTPFLFEGPRRSQQARSGIEELEGVVDTMIVIDNNNLQKILGPKVKMKRAFEEADQVLGNAARGIAEIITSEGYINVDFADVCTIMKDGGKALMGTSVAAGEDRAISAVEAAVNSPLLDNIDIEGARAIVLNITASEDSLGMDETTEIVEYVQRNAGNQANIIYGIVYDESMGDDLRVTVIATRFEDVQAKEALQEPISEIKEVEAPQVQEKPEAPAKPPVRYQSLDLTDSQSPREAYLRRLDRKEREERIQKLNSKVYDIHDPESLQGLETTPAYLRKRRNIEDKPASMSRLSRLSIDEDEDEKYKLRDNNSFLHDNVD
ncbi:cell division protein FtsZ [Pontibacter sp. G13]|uniref:cell division protein FtsZ n=1 Tax=Pontibacter sp. G13 TaxID=3074898 RepID=UPI00288B6C9C|nr:cell division protein FtsZ [Pontibacter sp. G13]WNJ20250.1 cell division protein FtsZ [Pontibacter sp. G13]